MSNQTEKTALYDVHFVKDVVVGSINPNNPLSDEGREIQVSLLNRCLNDLPKGVIIGSDVTIGRYMIGQHELMTQKTVYHIGFTRKPQWLQKTETPLSTKAGSALFDL